MSPFVQQNRWLVAVVSFFIVTAGQGATYANVASFQWLTKNPRGRTRPVRDCWPCRGLWCCPVARTSRRSSALAPITPASHDDMTLLLWAHSPIDDEEGAGDDDHNDSLQSSSSSPAPPCPPDMRYIARNVQRQHQNFVAIRQAAGKELTNDVYVREPGMSNTFWFAGKVARVSDISTEEAISRQWSLIETHAAHLRPLELYPARGTLEIWVAPGDSEMLVAYNQPNVRFQKMSRHVIGVDQIKNNMVGFQGEMYESGELGFRTWRLEDGSPAKPEIQTPAEQEEQQQQQNQLMAPTEEEFQEIQKALEGKDINALYEEQQRRQGLT